MKSGSYKAIWTKAGQSTELWLIVYSRNKHTNAITSNEKAKSTLKPTRHLAPSLLHSKVLILDFFGGSATEGSLMHTLLNIQFQVRLSIHVWTFPFLSNERTSQKVEHKRNFSQCDKMWPDNSMKSLCSLYRSPFHNSWISQNEGDSHELSFPGQKPRLAKNILAHEEYDQNVFLIF